LRVGIAEDTPAESDETRRTHWTQPGAVGHALIVLRQTTLATG
jgi:hypothetical protein